MKMITSILTIINQSLLDNTAPPFSLDNIQFSVELDSWIDQSWLLGLTALILLLLSALIITIIRYRKQIFDLTREYQRQRYTGLVVDQQQAQKIYAQLNQQQLAEDRRQIKAEGRKMSIRASSLMIKLKRLAVNYHLADFNQTLTEILKSELKVNQAAIYLIEKHWDESSRAITETLKLYRILGESNFSPRGEISVYQPSVEQYCYQQGSPIWPDLALEDSRLLKILKPASKSTSELPDENENSGSGCQLAIPLIERGEVIGILAVYQYQPLMEDRELCEILFAIVSLYANLIKFREQFSHTVAELESREQLSKKALEEMAEFDQLSRKFIPHEILDILKANKVFKLPARKQEITVLFTDIRNFTTISENMEIENLLKWLNLFLEEASQIIYHNNGIVDKYIGDCVMAVFGAPLSTETHAADACRAAYQLVSSLDNLNSRIEKLNLDEELKQRCNIDNQLLPTICNRSCPALIRNMPCSKEHCQLKFRISIGVGINSGIAALGVIGSENRISYTCLGDTVNQAARLESATHKLKAPIVVSEATRQAADDEFEFKFLKELTVKGKILPIRTYALIRQLGQELAIPSGNSLTEETETETEIQFLETTAPVDWDSIKHKYKKFLTAAEKGLNSNNPANQRKVLTALKENPIPVPLELVNKIEEISLLNSEDRKLTRLAQLVLAEKLRLAGGIATEALKTIEQEGPEALPEFLGSPDFRDRIGACLYIINQRGPLEILPELEKLLKTETNIFALSSLVKAVGSIGTEEQLPLLIPCLKHSNSRVRANAAEGVQLIGGLAATGLLLKMTTDSDHRVQGVAINAILKDEQTQETARKLLNKLAESTIIEHRNTALYILAETDFAERTELLRKLLRDSELEIRIRAACVVRNHKLTELADLIKLMASSRQIEERRLAKEILKLKEFKFTTN